MHRADICRRDGGFGGSAPCGEENWLVLISQAPVLQISRKSSPGADNATELFREFLFLMSWMQIFLSRLSG